MTIIKSKRMKSVKNMIAVPEYIYPQYYHSILVGRSTSTEVYFGEINRSADVILLSISEVVKNEIR